MSAREAVQAAVAAALRASAGLKGATIFDATPARATLPFVVIEEPVLTDWSTKSWAGREARLTLTLQDGGERPVRLRALAGAAEAAVLALAGEPSAELGGGWRLANAVPLRSRVARTGDRWTATAEFVLRLYQD